jgi:hypothetical protein
MLRLIHPAPEGQEGTRPPGKRRHVVAPTLFLSEEEVRHLRAATKNLARAYGSLDCLAKVMGLPIDTMYRATTTMGRRVSGTFAIRLAKAGGVSVETVLGGQLAAMGRCLTCGHKPGDGRIVAARGGS